MSTYEADLEIVVHATVRVTVEAGSKEEAIDKGCATLPSHLDPEGARRWKATVDLKGPKGIQFQVLRTVHVTQASGGEKARKVSP